MKKIILATALAFAAFTSSAVIAPTAEAAATEYPNEFLSSLQFTSLTDYAIYGDSYAFAEGTKLYVISPDEDGDRHLNSPDGFDCSVEIKNLGYDAEGNLYVGNAEGKTYKYPDLSETVEYSFDGNTNVVIEDYTYFIVAGILHWKFSDVKMGDFGEGYTKLKKYAAAGEAESAYVIKDNKLYRLDGENQAEVTLEYTDFSSAKTVSTGNASETIKNEYAPKKVIVRPETPDGEDVYCTEVDLSDLSGPYFITGRTTKLTIVRSALAIGETGNATIIIMLDESGDTKSYLTLTSALEATDDKIYEAPDIASAYILETTKLYSRPYMCGATEIATLEKGLKVNVTEKPLLDFADGKISFYKISCEQDGQITEGYIAANYLTPYSFSGESNNQDVVKDEQGSENDVRNVLITLAIVALVLIAVGYITFVLTNDKAKRKRGNANNRRRL